MAALALWPLAFALGAPVRAQSSDDIVVRGEKRQLTEALEAVIGTSRNAQLARFEKPVCPAVRGLRPDWSMRIERIIRANVVAAGGKPAPEGCEVNAIALFVGDPHELVVRLNARHPSFFAMRPAAFDRFARPGQPAYSWRVTGTYGSRGQILRHISSLTWADPNSGAIMTTRLYDPAPMPTDETGSRLVTGVRDEIEAGFVAIDRDLAEGKSLRQLADFATLHLMLEIKPGAGRRDGDSILALFEQRPGWVPPARMSNFDRGALSGFYTQKYNNRSAVQQRENIAAAMRSSARASEKQVRR